jgi:16S rRNA processing protein RimM
MMDTSDFFYLGKVVKTHGIHGELSGFVDADDPLVYSTLHGVFINTRQGLLPYEFDSLKIEEKGRCLFKLKDIDTIEQAGRFVSREMYLPLNMLPPLTGNNFYFHEVKGYAVIDVVHGNIGVVTGVIESTMQPLLQVEYLGKEILIPLHDDIIINLDRTKKIMKVKTPDGLVDVYLEDFQ